MAQKNGYDIDIRQELLALSVTNAAMGFGQSFPVAGGMSQSAVNDKAGAKTPLALVFASAAIAVMPAVFNRYASIFTQCSACCNCICCRIRHVGY